MTYRINPTHIKEKGSEPSEGFLTKVLPVVNSALQRGESVLTPRKYFEVYLFNDAGKFVAERMEGASGFIEDDQAMYVGVNPSVPGWENATVATTGHEFNHIIRLQYTGKEDTDDYTLVDKIALEGLAQNFENSVYGRRAPYAVGMSEDDFRDISAKIGNLIGSKDKALKKEFFFGSENGSPYRHWDGYRFSFKSVGERIDELMYREDAAWRDIMKMDSRKLVSGV